MDIAVIAPRAFVFVEPRQFLQPVRPSTVVVNNTTIINNTVNITNVKIVNGGRKKWQDENRPMSKETPHVAATTYHAPERADYKIRAFRDQVLEHVLAKGPLVDVRSPAEPSIP